MVKVKSESEAAQSCPTLSDPRDCSTRLLRPWDFPGKSTGVGCHCLLQLMYISEEMNLKKVKTKYLFKMSEDYRFISLPWK